MVIFINVDFIDIYALESYIISFGGLRTLLRCIKILYFIERNNSVC